MKITKLKKSRHTRRNRMLSIGVAAVSVLWNAANLYAVPGVTELPSGGVTVAGQARIGGSASTMVVTQTTDRAVMRWNTFNIGSAARVQFDQPGSNSVVLNRVLSANPSEIYGILSANGKVFLVNSSGIVFGKGSRVDVGGLVASTMSIDEGEFMNGRYRFERSGSTASVKNEGDITAADGGLVALFGADVRNGGTIEARLGSVILAGGDSLTLTEGEGLWGVAVDPSTVATLIENRNIVQADGGVVLMRASTADGLVGTVVNTGEVRARTIGERQGRIMLIGDMESGRVEVGGKLDASAPDGGNGGFIETSAAQVKIADGSAITTAAPYGKSGTWLIDPDGFTIAASGGDMTGGVLSTALGGGNVSISSTGGSGSDGNVNVNDIVSWSANTLTLSATNAININAVMTASGSSKLVMNTGSTSTVNCNLTATGFTGRVDFPGRSGTGFLTINGEGYTVLNSLGSANSVTGADLQGMQGNLSGKYALGTDIDASPTSTWNGGEGWSPVGDFYGRFDGLGHTITNLFINRPTGDFNGLFGQIRDRYQPQIGSALRNLGLVGGSVTGRFVNGSFAAALFSCDVSNVYSTVNVSYLGPRDAAGAGNYGGAYTGGISGSMEDVTLTNSFSTGNVYSMNYMIGGITGLVSRGNIINCYATGNVTGSRQVGGIAGGLQESSCSIVNSYSTGNVSGTDQVGGLVGVAAYNGVEIKWRTATPTPTSQITDCYSTGLVTGTANGVTLPTNVGGMIGLKNPAHSITVSGQSYKIDTIITSSYWNTETSHQSASAGGTSLTSAQMKSAASFTGWDLAGKWRIYEGVSAPVIRSYQRELKITALDAVKTYDNTPYSGGNGYVYSIPGASPLGTFVYAGNSQGAVNVGTYTLTPSGLLSDQRYNISCVNGSLLINPALLTVTGLTALSRTYDAGTAATLSGTATIAPFNGDDVVLGGTAVGTFADKNVGTGKSVTVTGNTISGTDAGNYTLVQAQGLTADISSANLLVTGLTAQSKVYDAGTTATLSGTASITPFTGDVVTLGGIATGSFADKNVGTGKAVTVAGSTISGTDASNYTLLQASGLMADITQAPLPVTGLAALSRVADGGTAAVLTGTASITPISGDDVVLGGTPAGSFADKNAGTGKTVTVTGNTISGTDASNYALQQESDLLADIYPNVNAASILTTNDSTSTGTSSASDSQGSNGPVTGAVIVDRPNQQDLRVNYELSNPVSFNMTIDRTLPSGAILPVNE